MSLAEGRPRRSNAGSNLSQIIQSVRGNTQSKQTASPKTTENKKSPTKALKPTAEERNESLRQGTPTRSSRSAISKTKVTNVPQGESTPVRSTRSLSKSGVTNVSHSQATPTRSSRSVSRSGATNEPHNQTTPTRSSRPTSNNEFANEPQGQATPTRNNSRSSLTKSELPNEPPGSFTPTRSNRSELTKEPRGPATQTRSSRSAGFKKDLTNEPLDTVTSTGNSRSVTLKAELPNESNSSPISETIGKRKLYLLSKDGKVDKNRVYPVSDDSTPVVGSDDCAPVVGSDDSPAAVSESPAPERETRLARSRNRLIGGSEPTNKLTIKPYVPAGGVSSDPVFPERAVQGSVANPPSPRATRSRMADSSPVTADPSKSPVVTNVAETKSCSPVRVEVVESVPVSMAEMIAPAPECTAARSPSASPTRSPQLQPSVATSPQKLSMVNTTGKKRSFLLKCKDGKVDLLPLTADFHSEALDRLTTTSPAIVIQPPSTSGTTDDGPRAGRALQKCPIIVVKNRLLGHKADSQPRILRLDRSSEQPTGFHSAPVVTLPANGLEQQQRARNEGGEPGANETVETINESEMITYEVEEYLREQHGQVTEVRRVIKDYVPGLPPKKTGKGVDRAAMKRKMEEEARRSEEITLKMRNILKRKMEALAGAADTVEEPYLAVEAEEEVVDRESIFLPDLEIPHLPIVTPRMVDFNDPELQARVARMVTSVRNQRERLAALEVNRMKKTTRKHRADVANQKVVFLTPSARHLIKTKFGMPLNATAIKPTNPSSPKRRYRKRKGVEPVPMAVESLEVGGACGGGQVIQIYIEGDQVYEAVEFDENGCQVIQDGIVEYNSVTNQEEFLSFHENSDRTEQELAAETLISMPRMVNEEYRNAVLETENCDGGGASPAEGVEDETTQEPISIGVDDEDLERADADLNKSASHGAAESMSNPDDSANYKADIENSTNEQAEPDSPINQKENSNDSTTEQQEQDESTNQLLEEDESTNPQPEEDVSTYQQPEEDESTNQQAEDDSIVYHGGLSLIEEDSIDLVTDIEEVGEVSFPSPSERPVDLNSVAVRLSSRMSRKPRKQKLKTARQPRKKRKVEDVDGLPKQKRPKLAGLDDTGTILAVHDGRLFSCPLCGFRTMSAGVDGLMALHLHNKHQEEIDKRLDFCEFCQIGDQLNLARHMLTHACPLLVCEKCDRMVAASHLPYHYKNCNLEYQIYGDDFYAFLTKRNRDKPRTLLKCRVCGKVKDSSGKMDLHQRQHRKIQPFKCPHCPMCFVHQYNVRLHVKSKHIAEKEYKCKYCDREYPRYQHLKVHIENKHMNIRVQCHLCQAIVTKRSFSSHQMIHAHSKSHHCPACKKSFRRASTLNTHKCKPIPELSVDLSFLQPTPDGEQQTPQVAKPAPRTRNLLIPRKKYTRKDSLLKKKERALLMGATGGEVVIEGEEGKETVYECEICVKTFPNRQRFNEHVMVHASGLNSTEGEIATEYEQAVYNIVPVETDGVETHYMILDQGDDITRFEGIEDSIGGGYVTAEEVVVSGALSDS